MIQRTARARRYSYEESTPTTPGLKTGALAGLAVMLYMLRWTCCVVVVLNEYLDSISGGQIILRRLKLYLSNINKS